jgi:hypothetical protein
MKEKGNTEQEQKGKELDNEVYSILNNFSEADQFYQHKATIELEIRRCIDCAKAFPRINGSGIANKVCQDHYEMIEHINGWKKLLILVESEGKEIGGCNGKE